MNCGNRKKLTGIRSLRCFLMPPKFPTPFSTHDRPSVRNYRAAGFGHSRVLAERGFWSFFAHAADVRQAQFLSMNTKSSHPVPLAAHFRSRPHCQRSSNAWQVQQPVNSFGFKDINGRLYQGKCCSHPPHSSRRLYCARPEMSPASGVA